MSSYMWIPQELRRYDIHPSPGQTNYDLSQVLQASEIHPVFARENFLAASHDDLVIACLRKRTPVSDLPALDKDIEAFVTLSAAVDGVGGGLHSGWNDSVYARLWGSFDYRRFVDGGENRSDFPLIDVEVYKRLEPALRLASRFLDLALPFFHRVRWGRTSEHRSRTRPGRRGRVFELLPPDDELPDEQRLASFTKELRDDVAKHILFFQAPTLDNAYMRTSRFGSRNLKDPTDWSVASVQIGRTFWGAFLDPSQWNRLDPYSRRGEQLETAIILIHELAHVVYYFSRTSTENSLRQRRRREETFFNVANFEDQAFPELGHALDRWLFGGGPVRSIKYGTVSRGVRWYWRTTKYDDNPYQDQHVKATTPDMFAVQNAMDSPYRFFDDGAWLRHLDGKTPFKLVLTPVRAFGELSPNATTPYEHFGSDLDRLALGRRTMPLFGVEALQSLSLSLSPRLGLP